MTRNYDSWKTDCEPASYFNFEAEKLECHGCKETKEDCVSKDDTICCPECSPYWDEWCSLYQEGLIEWCEFSQYIARINYNKTIYQHDL